MYKDFIEALNKKYNCTGEKDLEGLDLQHYSFASSSNLRAKDAIGVFEAYGLELHGLRILDVGCAYGGFAIETARRGATAYGVEILEELYDFACANNRDEDYGDGSCQFVLGDVTSRSFLNTVPENYFDLIIVNDVFEHVYDTVQLLENLSKVASDKCILFFVIPNGNDLDAVAREGHTGLCGLSIVRPLSWHKLTGEKSKNIYYRQFEYYQALFEHYGFAHLVPINYPAYYGDEFVDTMNQKFQETERVIAEKMGEFPERYAGELERSMKLFTVNYQYDIAHMKPADLSWKYGTYFWAGFAMKKSLDFHLPQRTCESRFASDVCEEATFELKRTGDEIEIVVNSKFSEGEYEYAYHLIQLRRGKEVCNRTKYQSETQYKWKLPGQGMYGVVIYIKHKDHEHKDYRILTQPLYYPGRNK